MHVNQILTFFSVENNLINFGIQIPTDITLPHHLMTQFLLQDSQLIRQYNRNSGYSVVFLLLQPSKIGLPEIVIIHVLCHNFFNNSPIFSL